MKRIPILMMLIAACSGAALAAEKKDPQAEAEAREAAAEEQAEAANPESAQKTYSGVVRLAEPIREDDLSKPIGEFVVGARVYLLRVDNKGMIEQLKKHKGEVSLTGLVRNSGKYFIAKSMMTPPALPVKLRNRKGI